MGKTQGIRLRSNPPRSAPTRAMRRTSPETACVAKEGAAALSVAGADSIIVGDGSWSACDSISSLEISPDRSEEHTSELQSLMRTSYAVFCLKKKIIKEHSTK